MIVMIIMIDNNDNNEHEHNDDNDDHHVYHISKNNNRYYSDSMMLMSEMLRNLHDGSIPGKPCGKKCFPSSNNHRSDGLIVLLSLIIIIRIIYIYIHIWSYMYIYIYIFITYTYPCIHSSSLMDIQLPPFDDTFSPESMHSDSTICRQSCWATPALVDGCGHWLPMQSLVTVENMNFSRLQQN